MKHVFIILTVLTSLISSPSWGQSSSCLSSPDGSSISCGGLSSSCLSSPDGSDISCGGQSSSCLSSPDGSSISCGGFDQWHLQDI